MVVGLMENGLYQSFGIFARFDQAQPVVWGVAIPQLVP